MGPGDTTDRTAMDGSPARVELRRDDLDCGYIQFQAGPEPEGINGTTIEAVIEVLVNRLEDFQRGRFACVENQLAIIHLNETLACLERRTEKRRQQGVEGKDLPHDSSP